MPGSTDFAAAVVRCLENLNDIAIATAAKVVCWAGMAWTGAVVHITNDIHAEAIHIDLTIAAITLCWPVTGTVTWTGCWSVWGPGSDRHTAVVIVGVRAGIAV